MVSALLLMLASFACSGQPAPGCVRPPGAECGTDSCGNAFSDCQTDKTCEDGDCVPICVRPPGVECGTDNCGNAFSDCEADQTCNNGDCVPICTRPPGAKCGTDSCGNMFNDCNAHEKCNEIGQCKVDMTEYCSQLNGDEPVPIVSIGVNDDTHSNSDWHEFTSTAPSPTHIVGSNDLTTVRKWIGNSTCASCSNGISKHQRLQFDNLEAGAAYHLIVHPSYLAGTPDYSAIIVSGNGIIIVGGSKRFVESGYFQIHDTWRIEFVPATASLIIDLGNGRESGNNYLYFDWLAFGRKCIRVALSDSITVGQRDYAASAAAWDEFSVTDTIATYVVGQSNNSAVRPWIGHSTCSSCTHDPTKQRFAFNNLVVGAHYFLTAYPANIKGTAVYGAQVVAGVGSIIQGAAKAYDGFQGYCNITHQWIIEFIPATSSLTVQLGNDLIEGANYMYMDYYVIAPADVHFEAMAPVEYSRRAAAKDTVNNGNWYKDEPYSTTTQRYNWNEAYVMHNYNYLFSLTNDRHWLEKLVDHADSVLAKRDNVLGLHDYRNRLAPAWQERDNHRYVWVGFTGALYSPMVEFAHMVLSSPILDGSTLNSGARLHDKAMTYINEFQAAVDFHEPDWVQAGSSGYYIFPLDIPVEGGDPLKGKPAAFNMIALMADALLDLAACRDILGQSSQAAIYFDKVASYARYFRSQWLLHQDPGGPYYTWAYSSYYSRPDDVGHSNFSIPFVVDCYRAGIVYNSDEMMGVANMFDGLIADNFDVPFNQIDRTYDPDYGRNSTYYLNFIAPFKAGTLIKANGKARMYNFNFLDFVVLPLIENESLY